MIGLALTLILASSTPLDLGHVHPQGPDHGLLEAGRFMIQLQNLRPHEVDEADPDVLVVDYSWDGGQAQALTRQEVRRLQERDGPDRLVLAYLSIGEAEDYRYYWKTDARKGRAGFVIRQNRRWRGNFRVRYWDPAWHRILYGGDDSYLDRILDRGFDGVFLDTVDAAEVQAEAGVKDAGPRMAELVKAIALHGRARDPGFVVLAQNPYCILEEDGLLDVISGVSAEAVLFRRERKTRSKIRVPLIRQLKGIRDGGRAVVVIEYVRSKRARRQFRDTCRENRFLCYAGHRLLGRPGWIVGP